MASDSQSDKHDEGATPRRARYLPIPENTPYMTALLDLEDVERELAEARDKLATACEANTALNRALEHGPTHRPSLGATGAPKRAHNAIRNLGRAWPDRYEEMYLIATDLDVALKSQIEISNTLRAANERFAVSPQVAYCVWEDCDQDAIYCAGHAKEYADGLTAPRPPQAAPSEGVGLTAHESTIIAAAVQLAPLLKEGWDEYDATEDQKAGSAACDALVAAVNSMLATAVQPTAPSAIEPRGCPSKREVPAPERCADRTNCEWRAACEEEVKDERNEIIQQLNDLMEAWGNNQIYYGPRSVVFRAWSYLRRADGEQDGK